MSFPALEHPIVGAPLAGGPSTPELAAAVSVAGGLGYLAAGYLSPETAAEQIARVRELTDAPYGLNIFFHRGSFHDVADVGELGLLPLLRLTARATELPLVAAGGIADGAGVAAVLAGGAIAAQVGTALMRCPEAGTSAAHREALARPGATRITRAFTGRRARGIVNEFMEEHSAEAPAAYPHVHHLTAPLRAAARAAGDAEAISLWAGEAYPLAREEPASDVVRRLGAEARAALTGAQERRVPPNPAGR